MQKKGKKNLGAEGKFSFSEYCKVSSKKSSHKIYFCLLLVLTVMFFVYFCTDGKQSENSVVGKKNVLSHQYEADFRQKLQNLTDQLKVRSSTLKKKVAVVRFQIDEKRSKERLARQNAPMSMYSSMNAPANKHNYSLTAVSTASRIAGITNPVGKKQLLSESPLNVVRLAHPEYMIPSGEFIHAVLETAINSDLPGAVRAVISRPAFSFTGQHLLIPAGSHLLGEYSAAIFQGQQRVMVIWKRVITPGGLSIQIDSPGADVLGRSGQRADSLETHFLSRFGQSALLSLIGAGIGTVGVSPQDQYNSLSTFRSKISESFQQSAGRSLEAHLAIKPTLHIHQGAAINVFAARDLDFYLVLHNK